jgi:3-oxoacyl-[acyl-carrier protein] reductase
MATHFENSGTKPRVILVTGANGGLGQAVARAFLAESPNHYVWLGVHSKRTAAAALHAEFPDRSECLALDVTRPAGWKTAVDQILQKHSRLDVLVNNAGRHEDGLLATMSLEAWEGVRAANLDATFHGCQAVLRVMISQRHGRIVNVASLSALLPPAGQGNYSAAKAGIVALSQSLAKEVARMNITVNVVCPGYIDTEALSGMSDEERKTVSGRIPMRRLGRPAEVAAAVRFLAGDEASYITGAIIKVDGGIY